MIIKEDAILTIFTQTFERRQHMDWTEIYYMGGCYCRDLLAAQYT